MRLCTRALNSGSREISDSFATISLGPAGREMTRVCSWISTISLTSRSSARVNTSTLRPRSPRRRATSATYTLSPPASPTPGVASGEVCMLIIATRRGYSADVGTQHLRRRQRRADRVVRLLGEYPGWRASQRVDPVRHLPSRTRGKVGVPGLHIATLAGCDRPITLALSRAGPLPLRFSRVRASQDQRSCAVVLE